MLSNDRGASRFPFWSNRLGPETPDGDELVQVRSASTEPGRATKTPRPRGAFECRGAASAVAAMALRRRVSPVRGYGRSNCTGIAPPSADLMLARTSGTSLRACDACHHAFLIMSFVAAVHLAAHEIANEVHFLPKTIGEVTALAACRRNRRRQYALGWQVHPL